MAVDKIVDHMSGIQPARRVIHRRVPPRSYGVAILNNLSIEYFPAPVMYSSKKPPIMLRFLKKAIHTVELDPYPSLSNSDVR